MKSHLKFYETKCIASGVFIVCMLIISFPISASADKKLDGVAEIVSKLVKKLNRSDEMISREQLTSILREDVVLCYGMSEDGFCGHAEYPTSFHKNGVDFLIAHRSDNDKLVVFSQSMKWEGNTLCHTFPYFLSVYSARDYTTQFKFDLSNLKRHSIEEINRWNNEEELQIGSKQYCYGYKSSDESDNEFVQLEFIDEVIQPSRKFITVSFVNASKGIAYVTGEYK